MTYSPWAMLAGMPSIELIWTADDELLRGADAWWDPEHQVIYMDNRLKRLVQRCALAHELAHVVRGDSRCDNEFFDYRAELAADHLAARWLLEDMDELAEQLRITDTIGHAAWALHVTIDILEARLAGLTDDERLHLQVCSGGFRVA